jgi:hypothetical protein
MNKLDKLKEAHEQLQLKKIAAIQRQDFKAAS